MNRFSPRPQSRPFSYMKSEKILALIAVVLAPWRVVVAQTPNVQPVPGPGTITTTGSTAPPAPAPGDTLAHPPEAAVIAHGTAPEVSTETPAALTNEPGVDEVAPV